MKLNFWSKKNTPKVEKTTKEKIIDNIKAIVIALIVALLIRSFLVQAFYIPSGSMKPNLLEGDYLFVTKYNYGYSNHSLPFSLPLIPSSRVFYSQPNRGDVVIFKYPGDNTTDYVKRLIGLPGDKIQVINSIVYINDVPLKREFVEFKVIDGIPINIYREFMNDKSYLIWQIKDYYSHESQFFGPITLGKDEFFMMGDNRDMSRDSRFSDVGAVPKSNLVGKGGMIFFSINGSFLEVWKWFTDIRFDRIFKLIK
ncbi:MAG: signal peptidase I [Alphaproteobacteria bacterium]|jgi:signal peptidase I|nr:signal peptidase I [Alphaproteobacteria bacterium]